MLQNPKDSGILDLHDSEWFICQRFGARGKERAGMKKAYIQPDILFESFALNENIASGNRVCNRNITNQYSGSCGLLYGKKMVFTVAAAGCRTKIEDGSSMVDGLCYHIPTAEKVLFNS